MLEARISPSLDRSWRYQVTIYRDGVAVMGSWSDTIGDARTWAKWQGARKITVQT